MAFDPGSAASVFSEYLMSAGLGEYIQILTKNDITTMETAKDITETDLKEMNFTIGARKKFMKMVKNTAEGSDSNSNSNNSSQVISMKRCELLIVCLTEKEMLSLKCGDWVDCKVTQTTSWMKCLVMECGQPSAVGANEAKVWIHPQGCYAGRQPTVESYGIGKDTITKSRMQFAQLGTFEAAISKILLTQKHFSIVKPGDLITVKDMNGVSVYVYVSTVCVCSSICTRCTKYLTS